MILAYWNFEPKIPMGLWWMAAIVSSIALILYLWRSDWYLPRARRALISALLGLGVLGPLLIALNPTWIEPIKPPSVKPMMNILVDSTQSMATPDGNNDGSTRWQAAIQSLRTIPTKHERIDVRVQAFSDRLESLELNEEAQGAGPSKLGNGHRSDLAFALRQSIRSGAANGHAILLASDGAHNVGSTEGLLGIAREAKSLDIPIYTLTLGTSVGIRNLSLAARSPRMIAFADHPLVIKVRVGQTGMAGQSAQVVLERDDRVIDSQRIRLTDEPIQEVRFTMENPPAEPLTRYFATINPIEGEATEADNRTSILVQKLESPIRILLLEGKPYWDSKFLSRNLVTDPTVQLSTLIRMTPQRFLVQNYTIASAPSPRSSPPNAQESNASATPTDDGQLPEGIWSIDEKINSPLERSSTLAAYRIVVLGRDAESYLTEKGIENLRDWISKQGGCLICSRGAPSSRINSRLSEILPVQWTAGNESRFRSSLSQYGFDAAVFDPLLGGDGDDPLQNMPSLATSANARPKEGLPQVLAESIVDDSGQTIPVISFQSFGSGQTVVVEGAGMWRWAFLPPQHSDQDKVYPTLWQSLIQWVISQQDLLPGQKVGIRPDRSTFLAGDRVSATLTTRKNKLATDASTDNQAFEVTLSGGNLDIPRRIQPSAWGNDADLYKVDFGALEIGFYHASVSEFGSDKILAETVFEVRDPWFEKLEVDSRPDLMRRLSLISGGEVLGSENVKDVVERFEHRILENRPERVTRKSLWDKPFVLLGILGLWMTSWVVRRRSGLV